MSNLLDLSDAVVSEINSQTWSLPFTAVRQNVPRFDAANPASLQVTVRPKDRVSTRATRAIMQDMMRVYIGIQQQLASDDNSQSDPLICLGEEIQTYFDLKNPLASLPPVICEGSSFGSDNDATWLNVANQNEALIYTGLIVVTFRAMRKGAA